MKVGDTYYLYFSKNNPNNTKIYIRAIIDKKYIIYKTRLDSKAEWQYDIDSITYFNVLKKHNVLIKIENNKSNKLKTKKEK